MCGEQMRLTKAQQFILKTAKNAFERQADFALELRPEDPENPKLRIHAPEMKVELELVIVESLYLTYAMTMLFKRMLDINRKIILVPQLADIKADELRKQIGRASCRERV